MLLWGILVSLVAYPQRYRIFSLRAFLRKCLFLRYQLRSSEVLQESVRRVIEPIYEEDFKPFSCGFRPGRSQHQAIEYLFKEVSFGKKHYIIDADIKNYFGSIDHGILREFLDQRVKDGVIRRMIDKWLKAGVMEKGNISYSESGSPQGSVISPLLSNVYLHYVLDEWFSEQIQPMLKGQSFIVRFADDCVP
ncbi:hypothetical protein LCGC14_2599060 [marine sediment metagenome]|uniref:Reverse transcriptase domain-containing protein n=1 Tax=marine sediment metagenome TaxID=412755 RepID=A0A0F9D1Z3_9ZZZZ